MTPTVTVVVPARDEAADLEGALAALADQVAPDETLEVIVVDGGSTDGTAAVARRLMAELGLPGSVVDGPGSTPENLNAGLAAARGDVLCRVDARSRVPAGYVARCAQILRSRPDVVVVGGSQVALPPCSTAAGAGIARALNNRWAMGGSRYRAGAASGPADTVYLGAFRTADLRAAGGWDPRFTTNQDFELNRRLGQRGVVWFEEGLPVGYIPRRSLRQLSAQYRRFGRAKVRYWHETGDAPVGRQRVLMAAPAAVLLAGVGTVLAAERRCRQLLRVGALAAVGLAAVDAAGSASGADQRSDGGGVRARLTAMAATATVSGSWLAGIAEEQARYLVRRRR
jgi:glycosyltransferase involved in cell wall biosynthesis